MWWFSYVLVEMSQFQHNQMNHRLLKCAKDNLRYPPITAADLLNDRVLPFFQRHELPMLRILTDRGTEYCGRAEKHDYQLYLALNDIDHTKTKA
jgi:hypothetical protein